MKKRPDFMPDQSPQERLRTLRDNFESKHESYYKELTQDEIDAKQADVARNCITIFKKENELKTIKDRFKEEINPLKDENIELLTQIDTGQEEVKHAELFFVPDFEEKVMITYNAQGEYVSERRLKPGELVQHRMDFGALRPAANDE
jgi:hypothetical protein